MAPPRTVVTTSSCSLLLIYRPRKDERMTNVLLLCHGTADRQSALQWSELCVWSDDADKLVWDAVSWVYYSDPSCVCVFRWSDGANKLVWDAVSWVHYSDPSCVCVFRWSNGANKLVWDAMSCHFHQRISQSCTCAAVALPATETVLILLTL